MFGINKDLKIHFIGIGGIGMSGIAEILLNLGYSVSGSDLNRNANVEKLESKGAEIFQGHEASNVKDVQLIVYSSAINEKNPEIQKARELRLPIIKRAEMLAELMRLKYGIAVAGSHGKTTTTSFLSTILNKLDYKPTCIIGGIVKNLGGHALKGDGDYLVAEADESDGSFLFLNPIMSVITNIDNDHLDYYKTEENLEKAFEEFTNKIPFYGIVAINAHDPKSCDLLPKIRRPFLTYGIAGEEACAKEIDYRAMDIVYSEQETTFTVAHNDEKVECKISLAGKHNVLNAMGAISIAHKLGASLENIANAIGEFEGVGRRFELLHSQDQLVVVDDYGHHPTEVMATIETAKNKYPNKKLIAIFEPHRYTRTQTFWKEFVASFDKVDEVFVAPIYAASEEPIDYIDSEILVKNINERNVNASYLKSWEMIKEILSQYKKENAVILSLGAGSISKTMRQQIEEWKS